MNLAAGRAAIAVMRRDRPGAVGAARRASLLDRQAEVEHPASATSAAWACSSASSSRDRASREPDPEAAPTSAGGVRARRRAGRGRPPRERREDQSAADDRGRPRGGPGGDRRDRRTRLIETGVGVREVRNYIDGRWVDGGGASFESRSRDRRSRGDRGRVQSRRPVRGDRCGTADVRRHRLVDDGRQGALRDPLRASPAAAGRGVATARRSSSRARWAS